MPSCTWSSDSGSQLSEADSEGARGGGRSVSDGIPRGIPCAMPKFLYDMRYDLFKGSGASSARSAFILAFPTLAMATGNNSFKHRRLTLHGLEEVWKPGVHYRVLFKLNSDFLSDHPNQQRTDLSGA